MDLVTSSSVAGKSLASMSSAKRVEVQNELASSLQKNVNKSIKKTVLGGALLCFVICCILMFNGSYVVHIEFKKVYEDAMLNHLQESRLRPSELVRPKRKTAWDEKASLDN